MQNVIFEEPQVQHQFWEGKPCEKTWDFHNFHIGWSPKKHIPLRISPLINIAKLQGLHDPTFLEQSNADSPDVPRDEESQDTQCLGFKCFTRDEKEWETSEKAPESLYPDRCRKCTISCRIDQGDNGVTFAGKRYDTR